MKELILFIITFLIIFLIYEILIFRLSKRLLGKEVELIEFNYLVKKYKLDLKKTNYKKVRHVIALTSSLDMAIVISIVVLFDNFWLELLVAFVCTIILIIISYHIVYLIYKKKGMIKDESKRNRK